MDNKYVEFLHLDIVKLRFELIGVVPDPISFKLTA